MATSGGYHGWRWEDESSQMGWQKLPVPERDMIFVLKSFGQIILFLAFLAPSTLSHTTDRSKAKKSKKIRHQPDILLY